MNTAHRVLKNIECQISLLNFKGNYGWLSSVNYAQKEEIWYNMKDNIKFLHILLKCDLENTV